MLTATQRSRRHPSRPVLEIVPTAPMPCHPAARRDTRFACLIMTYEHWGQTERRGAGASACHWSFYIFSSGSSADELFFRDLDLEFLQKFGVFDHFLA